MADDGFLSRWSRRKAQVQRGESPPPEAPACVDDVPSTQPPVEGRAPAAPSPVVSPEPPSPPPPTLDDVETLTPQADFSRYVKADVEPGVQRAALKKLFADPHFNVMDGLDVYIDDYNTPDPLPKSMLRQMVQSRLLGLFDETPPAAPADAAQAASEPVAPMDDVAPPAPPSSALPSETARDEDPDLRLQPNDAAGRAGPEPGAGTHAGREP
jgi:hypothetical protein